VAGLELGPGTALTHVASSLFPNGRARAVEEFRNPDRTAYVAATGDRIAESKSSHFLRLINAHSENRAEFGSLSINRVSRHSE
jgi:hypothetical protein